MPGSRRWWSTRWCAARAGVAELLGVGAELVILPVSVLAGTVEGDDAEPVIDELRAAARRARLDLLAGVQGGRLIVVLGGTDDPMAAAEKLAGLFGPGPLVVGPGRAGPATGLRLGAGGARRAAGGPRLARGTAPGQLGRAAARARARRRRGRRPGPGHPHHQPLLAGGAALLDTLTAYLEQGSSLEATARILFVHPNTVRYRLKPGHRADGPYARRTAATASPCGPRSSWAVWPARSGRTGDQWLAIVTCPVTVWCLTRSWYL